MPTPAPAPVPAEATPAVTAKPRSMLVLIIAFVLAATVAGGGVFWLMKPKNSESSDSHKEKISSGTKKKPSKKEEVPVGKPMYQGLDPAFVVNLADEDGTRYLQVDIQVMTRDEAYIDAVKLHAPLIRNQLLLLMAQNRTSDLVTREQREKLQALALAEVQKIMKTQTGKPGIEALYFTSFVTQ